MYSVNVYIRREQMNYVKNDILIKHIFKYKSQIFLYRYIDNTV